ncbi:MAG: MATE family efflux transporter [Oscillospiraceae bacterium]|nr:MATE family efflux transporter [Oscillospiraceae bacterium]
MKETVCHHITEESAVSCPHHASTQRLMTEGPILPQLLRYMFPLLMTQLLQQLYTMADAAMLGHCIGSEALAAQGTTSLLLSVIVNFFVGLSAGMSIILGHLYGHGDKAELKQAIKTCMTLSVLAGLFFTGVGLAGTGAFLRYLKTPPEIMLMARDYLRICFWGMLPQLVYNVAAAVLRALGNTRTPLAVLLCSAGLNVLLNLLFLVGLDMGIRGAALATLISQIIAMLLVVAKLCSMEEEFRLDGLALNRLYLRESAAKGLPAGLQAVFMSISSLVLQTYINSFGPDAMAGMTVYARIEGFLYYPLFAFGLALTAFISQNEGAGKLKRVFQGLRIGMKLSVGGCLVLSGILVFTSRWLVFLFTRDAGVIENALEAIYWNYPFYFMFAINQMLIGAIRGLGNTTYPMFGSLCSYCVFRVLWCAILIPILHTMRVVYWSYDISWVILIALLAPRLYRYRSREA